MFYSTIIGPICRIQRFLMPIKTNLCLSPLGSTFAKSFASIQTKTKNYLDRLIENKYISPTDNVDECALKISTILEQYEYELYNNSYILLEDVSLETDILDEEHFQLTLRELNDIMNSRDGKEHKNIIHYFVKGKTTSYLNKFRKKAEKEMKSAIKKKKYQFSQDTMGPSGIWNSQNEIEYGLWRNALFVKILRSSVSHIYDRRLLSASCLDESNPRIIIDFDYVGAMNYFNIRRCATQIRQIIAFNKYKTNLPFTLEFFESEQTTRPPQFEDLLFRIIQNWNDGRFPYTINQGRSLVDMYPSPKSIYYILPSSRTALTESEVLNPNNVFVIPAYVTNNSRDHLFSKIHSQLKSQNIKFRRLPSSDYVVWNKFHGVLSMSNVFNIIHDIRYDTSFNWNTVFRKYLLGECIKTDEELFDLERIRHERVKKRQRSINNSYSNEKIAKMATIKSPKRI